MEIYILQELAAAQGLLQVPKCTKIGDKILGVETIFPDNALKSSATNTVAETAASKLSVSKYTLVLIGLLGLVMFDFYTSLLTS